MKKKKIIIIGAGPAGLACALQLAKEDFDVHVYEASTNVGGMAQSIELWGQIVDLGPHRFFSKNIRINEFFKELIKNDYTLVNRLTRIYYNKRYFNYPLKLFNVLGNLNPFTVVQILYYYIIQRIFPIKDPKSFEEWVKNRFGSKLYEIFFKNYSEKLWGITCDKIDADWAAQRIKSLSLFAAVKSALVGNRGNKHKTLVDQFAYPNQGTGQIYTNAASSIRELGAQIHLKSAVKNVINDGGKVTGIRLFDDSEVYADLVISSMPITNLIKGFASVPKEVLDACSKLYFRNTTLVYLEVDSAELFEDNWIYIHSPKVLHGRITNFRNWCPGIIRGKSTSILCLEFWSFNEDELWKASDDFLTDLAQKELRVLGLIGDHHKVLNSHTIKVPKCYPVYERGYQEHLDIIVSYVKKYQNLKLIGRYGSFKYNNQDHSILMGILCADNVIQGVDEVDLWQINTDIEYQEEGRVKDVLVG